MGAELELPLAWHRIHTTVWAWLGKTLEGAKTCAAHLRINRSVCSPFCSVESWFTWVSTWQKCPFLPVTHPPLGPAEVPLLPSHTSHWPKLWGMHQQEEHPKHRQTSPGGNVLHRTLADKKTTKNKNQKQANKTKKKNPKRNPNPPNHYKHLPSKVSVLKAKIWCKDEGNIPLVISHKYCLHSRDSQVYKGGTVRSITLLLKGTLKFIPKSSVHCKVHCTPVSSQAHKWHTCAARVRAGDVGLGISLPSPSERDQVLLTFPDQRPRVAMIK